MTVSIWKSLLKFNFAVLMISLLERVESTDGKGENAGYQYFLLFPLSFRKPSSLGFLKGIYDKCLPVQSKVLTTFRRGLLKSFWEKGHCRKLLKTTSINQFW